MYSGDRGKGEPRKISSSTKERFKPVFLKLEFSLVQLLSHVQLFVTPWTAAHQASLSITNSQSLLKLVRRVGDAIQPSHPLSYSSPPTFNLAQHESFPISQLFASGGESIEVSASASVLPMNIQD